MLLCISDYFGQLINPKRLILAGADEVAKEPWQHSGE
jgi:hypothetical protein